MRRQVDLQRRRVRVGTVAVGTLVGFVFVVLPLVRLRGKHKDVWPSRSGLPPPDRVTYLEVGQLGESLFTAGVGAFIRPVARVDSVRERLKHLEFRPGREEHPEQRLRAGNYDAIPLA